MYDVFGDGKCIYGDRYPDEHINAVSPNLSLADNTAGSLTITVPVGNIGYDSLKQLTSEIVVKQDGKEIWSGRILSEKRNFQNSRELTCEGELAYLNDTVQPLKKYEYESSTVNPLYTFLKELLTIHNQKVMGETTGGDAGISEEKINTISAYTHVGPDKRFFVGSVTVNIADAETDTSDTTSSSESFSWTTDNDLTMNILSDIVDKYGGHLRIRKVVNSVGVTVRYLDYLKDYIGTTDAQEIRFGQNLLDFTRNWDLSELVTVAIPQGASQGESSEVDGADTYLTVKEAATKTDGDIRHASGSIYVVNEKAVNTYGRIERIVSFDDISDAEKLLTKTINYLKDEQFDDMTIELKAVDLRYLSKNVTPLKLLDEIHCVSKPHGMDRTFPITELNIQLDKPDNSTYTLNSKVEKSSVSGSSSSATLSGQIAKDYSTLSELNEAKRASISIINAATRGYVTITKSEGHSEAICISDSPANIAYDSKTDTWKNCKLWRWSMGGLAFFEKGYTSSDKDLNPGDTRIAITMDGAINADRITIGTLSAITIQSTKTITINNATVPVSKWNLNDGDFTMYKGSINLGTGVARDYAFSVDDNGDLYSESGEIGGFTITSSSIYNDTIELDSGGLSFRTGYNDSEGNRVYLGSYCTSAWSKNGNAEGLSVNMDPQGSYISWSCKESDSDEYYDVKLMYVAKNESITDVNGRKFKSDCLHLTVPLVMTRSQFEYERNGITYESTTLDGGNSNSQPRQIQLAYDLKFNDGVFQSGSRMTCYICNGLIMVKQ